MKVRWTPGSVRLRITPGELGTLRGGRPVRTSIALGDVGGWYVEVDPTCAGLGLSWRAGVLIVEMGRADVARLAEPDREGIYGQAGDPRSPRVLVEKDFPCAHPHSEEACEPETPRFTPTAAFLARRALPAVR